MQSAIAQATFNYRNGFFHLAEPVLREHFLSAVQNGAPSPTTELVDVIRMLMRIYSEMSIQGACQDLFETIQQRPLLRQACEADAKYLYCLALNDFFGGHFDLAQTIIERSIKLATDNSAFESLAYALILKIKLELGATRDPSVHMQNLKLILQSLQEPELNLSYLLLESEIALSRKNWPLAINKTWSAFELAKSTPCSHFFSTSTLAMIGYVYLQSGDDTKAALYLQVAKKSIIAESMIRLDRLIDALLEKCDRTDPATERYLDLVKHKLVLSSEHHVDLKNQFVLIELLHLFLKKPTQSFTKPDLAKLVWKESYDRERHDNLIYVNVKRLRTLVERNSEGIDLILRTKEGYRLNPEYKFSILHEAQKDGVL